MRCGLNMMRLDVMRLGIRISESQRFDPPAQRTRITIADTGTGIPPEVLPALFEPFVTNKGERGTGLGLWGTREIIKKNGWRIGARSSWMARQSGTVFSILILQLDTR
jgi:signal transduction histidine kinase